LEKLPPLLALLPPLLVFSPTAVAENRLTTFPKFKTLEMLNSNQEFPPLNNFSKVRNFGKVEKAQRRFSIKSGKCR